jgi:thioredoxin 1
MKFFNILAAGRENFSSRIAGGFTGSKTDFCACSLICKDLRCFSMNRRFFPTLFFLASLAVLPALVSCTDPGESGLPADGKTVSIPFVESEAHWQQLLAKSGQTLLVVEFYAEWCAPCRQLAPVLEKLARQFKGQTLFYRVDIDVHRGLARRYRVRGIPFTVLIADGKVVDSLFGLRSEREYRRSIEEQLDIFFATQRK